jgi:hypothetical protein
MATSHDARAVFHDRATMEEAVRALELEGIARKRIHVSHASTLGGVVRRPPERSGAMGAGAGFGAIVGVALALLSMLDAGDLSTRSIATRVVAYGLAGAFFGALGGLIARTLRHESRYGPAAGYRDYVVRVRADDPTSAESVVDLLARAGGDPLPT